MKKTGKAGGCHRMLIVRGIARNGKSMKPQVDAWRRKNETAKLARVRIV